MVKCHICNKELLPARQKKSWLKDHECPHCYAKKALIYCKSCYWWEVGPLPALAALPKELKAPEESEVQLVTPCPLEEEKKAQEAETLKERREALLKELKGKCTLANAQSTGEFETQLKTALEAYDNLYHPKKKGLELKQDKEDQRMVHTLIVIHLSALKRCSDPLDKYAHRHIAPLIAAKHLETCFCDPPASGKLFIPGDKKKIAAAALGQETIERYLKGKLSVARASKDFREACKAAGVNADLDLQEAARIAIMIYHCATVKRDADKTSEGKDFTKFKPYAASGYLSAAYKKEWYGGGAPSDAFNKKTQQRLGTLYATFCQKVTEEKDSRFEGDKDAINGLVGTVLTQEHADFLLSLPKMDHTGDAVGTDASPCELNVRKRVAARLARLFSDQGIKSDQVNRLFGAASRTRQFGADPEKACAEAKTKLDKTWGIRFKKKARLKKELLSKRIAARKCSLYGRYESVFKDKVFGPEGALRDVGALLDAIIDDMNSGTYWVEMTSKDGLFKGYRGTKEPRTGFFLKCQTHDYVKDIKWKEILPCKKPPGSFDGMVYDAKEELGSATDGRQKALEWYLDWRIEKDRLLYDYFDIPPSKLSVFASFTLHHYSEYPFPFPLYGHHNVIWDPNHINASRSVLTLGDRGFPRRSRLLLLQDVLCERDDKFGQEPLPSDKRFHVLQRLLLHLERTVRDGDEEGADGPPYDRDAHVKHITDLAEAFDLATDFDKDRHVAYYDGMYFPVVEAHIFGDAKIHGHSIAVTLAHKHIAPEKADIEMDNSKLTKPVKDLLEGNGAKCLVYGMRKQALKSDKKELLPISDPGAVMANVFGKPTAAEVDT